MAQNNGQHPDNSEKARHLLKGPCNDACIDLSHLRKQRDRSWESSEWCRACSMQGKIEEKCSRNAMIQPFPSK